jgi:hypothetical protein
VDYHTEFEGKVHVCPPLNAAEVAYLTAFNDSRRWDRPEGPFSTDDDAAHKPANTVRVGRPAQGQPGPLCPWRPTGDGTALIWDGGQNPHAGVEWMRYLINTFLAPFAAVANLQGAAVSLHMPPEFAEFTFNHVLTGGFHAEGEESDDNWSLLVRDNQVSREEGHVPLPDPDAVDYTVEQVVDGELVDKYEAMDDDELREHSEAEQAVIQPLLDELARLDGSDPDADRRMAYTVLDAMIRSRYRIVTPDGVKLGHHW